MNTNDSSRRQFLKNLGLVSGAFATGVFAAQPARAYTPAYSYSSVPPSSSSSAPGSSSSSSSSVPDSSSSSPSNSSSSSSSSHVCIEIEYKAPAWAGGLVVKYELEYRYKPHGGSWTGWMKTPIRDDFDGHDGIYPNGEKPAFEAAIKATKYNIFRDICGHAYHGPYIPGVTEM